MTSYLASGWFQQDGNRGLRTEVIDGAMDVAGVLARAEIPAHLLMRVALRVRALVAIADPQMVGVARFTDRERGRIQSRLEKYSDAYPELHAFVADCLERIDNISDLMAFYLHLIHVARMMQLLDVALHDSLMAQIRGDILKKETTPTATEKGRGEKKAAKRKPPAKRSKKAVSKKKSTAKSKKSVGKKTVSKKTTAKSKKTVGKKTTAKSKKTIGKKSTAKPKKTVTKKSTARSKKSAAKKASQKKSVNKKRIGTKPKKKVGKRKAR